jgi:hypothetical protein
MRSLTAVLSVSLMPCLLQAFSNKEDCVSNPTALKNRLTFLAYVTYFLEVGLGCSNSSIKTWTSAGVLSNCIVAALLAKGCLPSSNS